MAKEWILNVATNRWGLNKKDRVGPVSQWIRECDPKSIEDWEGYYYDKLKRFLEEKGINLSPEEYVESLGKILFVKITEVIHAEVEDVTEYDCVQYIYNLVINRTYDGYITEKRTVYEELQHRLNVKIEPAPDEWDRLYNVDFYIKVNDKYIGLQIKPITYEQTPELYKWKDWLSRTHVDFEKKYGGKVFIIFSIKRDGRKEIYNPDIIGKIEEEIQRLKALKS
ncbi:MjaI family restriction endonuclease [Rhodothermus marinus]|uniref:MjaI family restriction endonuclease n=1 Tax=Rhodothermus marinus TaxID=29549 RepID=UPI000A6EEFC3|nr:MjaI family restriction endonuclease [Rhodothermus marinus]